MPRNRRPSPPAARPLPRAPPRSTVPAARRGIVVDPRATAPSRSSVGRVAVIGVLDEHPVVARTAGNRRSDSRRSARTVASITIGRVDSCGSASAARARRTSASRARASTGRPAPRASITPLASTRSPSASTTAVGLTPPAPCARASARRAGSVARTTASSRSRLDRIIGWRDRPRDAPERRRRSRARHGTTSGATIQRSAVVDVAAEERPDDGCRRPARPHRSAARRVAGCRALERQRDQPAGQPAADDRHVAMIVDAMQATSRSRPRRKPAATAHACASSPASAQAPARDATARLRIGRAHPRRVGGIARIDRAVAIGPRGAIALDLERRHEHGTGQRRRRPGFRFRRVVVGARRRRSSASRASAPKVSGALLGLIGRHCSDPSRPSTLFEPALARRIAPRLWAPGGPSRSPSSSPRSR